ncbi:MAG TPA: hypothetical protein VG795_16185 [Acidimicrobiia bacterium]|nr:hypothetical protein [Acidimicrobiia bacterium]
MTQLRLRRAALVVLPVVLLAAAACGNGNNESSTTTTAGPTTTTTAASTTTAPLTKEAMVLGDEGVGPVTFGTNAAHTIARFMQALGPGEKNQPLPAGQPCGATRRVVWANFQILVNEVTSMSGAGKPGFAGWFLGSPGPHDFKTEKGIGIGSTVAALKAAYGTDVVIARGESGPAFTVTAAKGIITGQLDGQGDNNKIKNIQAGSYCGPA